MSDTVQQVDALRIGVPLEQDIYDGSGVLLLRHGTVVTQSFVERLKARGISSVSTSADGIRDEAESTESAPPGGRDRAASGKRGVSYFTSRECGPTPAAAHQTGDPQAYAIKTGATDQLPQLSVEQFESAAVEAEALMNQSFERWEQLGSRLLTGKPFDPSAAEGMLQGMMPLLLSDRDVIGVMLKLNARHLRPVIRHGVRVALMSMHLARHVGYEDAQCLDAGLVGLFADVGMSRVPATVVDAQRKLQPAEWLDIHRHPAYSADLLGQIDGIRPDIPVAVYQHHERLDGSGYPHGRKGMFLHPMARIVAVADIFAAVLDDRAHRPARGGHFAVKAVLQGVKDNRLDRVVTKALLDSVSLFPLGTKLTLGDGRRAEVFRTNPQHADRPLLTLLDGDDRPTKRKIDLSVNDTLKITAVDEAPLSRAA